MRRATQSRRPRLGLEALERRDTPAGTVTAKLSGTVLTLTGDDADNDIQINQTGPTAFTVVGNGTAIGGGLTFPIPTVTALMVFMKDGNDKVAIDTAAQFTLSGGASFDLGDGDNELKLVTDGRIDLGSLSIRAGDGQDHVTVSGGAGTGSQVVGNVVVALGIGRGPRALIDLDTHADFTRVAVHGSGGLKYTAAGGGDQLTFDTVAVDKAFSAAGGAGSLTVTATDSHFGSALLDGTTSPSSGATTSLYATRVTVAGATTLKTGSNINASFTDVSTGPLAVRNRAGYTDVAVSGALTVTGNFTFAGARHTLELSSILNPNPTPDDTALPSVLTVSGDLTMTGAWAVDIFNYGSEVHARNLTINSPFGNFSQDYDRDYSDSRLDLTGDLTFRGDDSYFDNRDGQVAVGGNVLFAAGSFAGFDLSHGSTGFQVRTTVTGNVTLTASTGEAKIQADGTALTIGGNLAVTGAGWTDVSYVTEELSTVGGTVTQKGGPEDDRFTADGNFQAGGLALTFKDGNNFVQIGGPDLPPPDNTPRPTTVNGNVKVTTGNGTDSVSVINARVKGTTTMTTGAGADEVALRAGAIFDRLVTIDLGAGADVFTAGLELPDPNDPTTPFIPAGTVTFNADATVKLGTGNDRMQLGVAGDLVGKVVVAAGATLTADGGLNQDTYDPSAGQTEGTIVIVPDTFELP